MTSAHPSRPSIDQGIPSTTRRGLLRWSALAGGIGLVSGARAVAAQDEPAAADEGDARLSYKGENMRFGLVTYQWGRDWDLATLLANCEKAGVLGVELRTTHQHGVEPSLGAAERDEVRRRFADSPVACLGPGSNENFDSPDPAHLAASIERTREFIRLSHDIGASGVKVKPDRFHDGVPREKTIEQIGTALRELAEYAAGYGQEVRLEVHGQCSPLPVIAQIMQVADHPQAVVCWNSNAEDLDGDGLEANFNLVKERFGQTAHVRELDLGDYPYAKLMELFVAMDYEGWILLEARTEPADRVQALIGQRSVWERMVRDARSKLD